MYRAKHLRGVRIHPNQVSKIHWRREKRRTGKIGTYLEIFKTIALLMQRKSYYANKTKRNFLIDKLKEYNLELTKLLKQAIPEL